MGDPCCKNLYIFPGAQNNAHYNKCDKVFFFFFWHDWEIGECLFEGCGYKESSFQRKKDKG